jgi:hypothetical protein
MIAWLRLKFVQLFWPSTAMRETGACANRKWYRGMAGPIEVTVTYRDTRQPNGYSREELLGMLENVRRHEAIQGWKVPEPN